MWESVRVSPTYEGTFRSRDGLSLYFRGWRPESPTPPKAVVALVHGFGEHSGRYASLIHYLVPRGYALYAFDLRGHGRSPGRRGHINSWQEFREDVGAFLQEVRRYEDVRPLFLFGHSMGGLMVLDYALHHPEGLKGVIASGPVLAQPGVSPVLLFISRVLSRVWPTFSLDTHLDASAISRDPDVVAAYRADPLVHSRASARLGTELTRTVEWVMAHADAWRLPLLILHGGADRLAPPEGSRVFFDAVVFEDKARIEYPGGFHEPHNDVERERVLADIAAWLEAHL